MKIITTNINGIVYEMNLDDFTASITESPTAHSNVFIPRSINHNNIDFIIIKIKKGSFRCNNLIQSIEFSDDSELFSIGKEAFAESSVETIFFPPKLTVLKEGWCYKTCKLNRILVHSDNENFKDFGDNLILQKSEKNFFDVLVFVPRNSISIEISSCVRCIDCYAFDSCKKLDSVKFSSDSALFSIHKSAFSESSIESISFPSSLTEIQDFAFYNCEKLSEIEFPSDSNLLSIGKYAFAGTTIKSFTIPGLLQKLDECWISGNGDVLISPENQNFSFIDENRKIIAGKTDLNGDVYDSLVYVDRSIESIVFPPSIKHITSFVFASCRNLQTVTIPENSELRSISSFAFSNSSINCLKISSYIEEFQEGWCFNTNNLSHISISSKNNNFIMLNEKMIIGKTNKNSEVYDVVVFACRNIEKAKIPSFIVKIDSFAFYGCNNLKTVEFSEISNLVSIGKSSFSNTSIEKISIPKHVTEICELSFCECKKLNSVLFSDDSELELIDKEAFARSGIQSILIPSTVKKINESCFSQCLALERVEFLGDSQLDLIDKSVFSMTSIQEISIPDNVKRIESLAFFCCKELLNVVISENSELTEIGKNSFSHSSINSIFIPIHVHQIRNGAFFNCENLETVIFPENSELEYIGKDAFLRTMICSVCIPKSVKIIGFGCFSECENLETIEFEEDSSLIAISQEAFAETQIETIHIPNHVQQIDQCAFHYCNKLQTIEIDDDSDLVSINSYAFADSTIEIFSIPSKVEYLGNYWCGGTTELMAVNVSPNNPYFKNIDDGVIIGKSDITNDLFDVLVFAPRDITKVIVPSSIRCIKSFAFSGCQNLKEIEFEKDSELRIIESYAFSSSSIEKIEIPLHVIKICESAFSDCDHLCSFEISEDSELESIDSFTFSESSIQSLTFPVGLVDLKQSWCGEISFLNNISISEKNKNLCFLDENNKIVLRMSDLNSGIFDTIAFACRDLEYAFIPSFIKSIDAYAFARCKKLLKVEFEENAEIQFIDIAAFSETNIKELVIPSSIQKIGRRCFLCCHFVRSVEFEPETKLEIIEKEAFEYSAVENLTLPETITQIGIDAFANCPNLTSVEFLSEYVSIEDNAFNNASSLCINSFPNASKISIENNAFSKVSKKFVLFVRPNVELLI